MEQQYTCLYIVLLLVSTCCMFILHWYYIWNTCDIRLVESLLAQVVFVGLFIIVVLKLEPSQCILVVVRVQYEDK